MLIAKLFQKFGNFKSSSINNLELWYLLSHH